MKLFRTKKICILISVTTLIVFSTLSFVEARPGYTAWGHPYPGDVNDDDSVDASDALIILQWSVGINTEDIKDHKADVNADGSIDAVDALLVLQYSVYLFDRFEGYQSVIGLASSNLTMPISVIV